MDAIEFVLNGTPVRLAGVRPGMTLLDWLRGPAGLTGTKEGCAEGDCGACTIVLERHGANGSADIAPANACLLLVGQLDGMGVRTIEGLRGADGAPHPLQTAFATSGATQCGFCTPGFVMAGYAHRAAGSPGGLPGLHDALAGNLCRCTGYRPIVDAIADADAPVLPTAPPAHRDRDASFGPIDGQRLLAPRSLAELLALRARHPDAWLLAGGTDLGLRVSVRRERPALLLLTTHVPELRRIERRAIGSDDDVGATPGSRGEHDMRTGLRVGGAVTYADLLPHLTGGLAPFAELLRWLGSAQIRALGTLGGNLGTASPIGDALPALVALGASVVLASAARGERVAAVEDFLVGYRRTLLEPDEVIVAVDLPEPPPGALLFCEKVSKRRDQDIATVGAAFLVGLEEGEVAWCRLAWGGMADRVRRSTTAEAALLGCDWTVAGVQAACRAAEADFAPLTDVRGGAAYRGRVAANLLRRAASGQGAATRLDLLQPTPS